MAVFVQINMISIKETFNVITKLELVKNVSFFWETEHGSTHSVNFELDRLKSFQNKKLEKTKWRLHK